MASKWLCFADGATLPTCGDPASGSIEGSIGASDILGPKAQGIDPAETTVLDEVLKAIAQWEYLRQYPHRQIPRW